MNYFNNSIVKLQTIDYIFVKFYARDRLLNAQCFGYDTKSILVEANRGHNY